MDNAYLKITWNNFAQTEKESNMEKRKITKERSSKRKSKSTNGKFQIFGAVLLITLGCCLLIAGFYAPPQGEIHSSVLVAFGEILTFVGAIFGIDYHYRCR